MNALEIADQLTHSSHQWGFALPLINESAAMLRRQHEAIVKLREALLVIQNKAGGTSALAYRVAEQALKDTEEFK